MPTPRKNQISLATTPYYHCISRCVRRTLLCGKDKNTGKNYEHRRAWIEKRILSLGEVFAIDICAYAVLSNHYHLVLHLNSSQAQSWSANEIVERWHLLCKGNPISIRFASGAQLSREEKAKLDYDIAIWHKRLQDISWFMRLLNEPIARFANKEDDCKGHFWESRFKSQALLDETALAACMAYVDLNPVRAHMAKTPADSAHTSIRSRIYHAKNQENPNHLTLQHPKLMPFAGDLSFDQPAGLPFKLSDYIDVINWTSNEICKNKSNVNNIQRPLALDHLNIATEQWCYLTQNFESQFKGLVGSAYCIKAAVKSLGKCWSMDTKTGASVFRS